MADLPTPRALPQILGSMVDDYLSRLDTSGVAPGLKSLKPGSSVLAFLESVAQGQGRGSQDLMNVLGADDIDRAKGARLDRIGRKEKVFRRGETFARGTVTVGDSRFQKVQTRIYAGMPAPIPGSVVVYAADASGFGTTGSLYIGRGTSNVEGPLPFTNVEQVAHSYWRITLASGTLKYHNLAESLVLAQQGDRVVDIGQVVSTPQGSTQTANYETKARVVVLDGENTLEGVPVTCQQSGTIGNCAAGAISVVSAPSFTGMTVTNPSAIQNGLAVEDDDHYRERIKKVRANRAKATPDALMARAYGIQATDEDSTITSARLVVRSGQYSTLFIDDGNGYEEKDAGINQEVLCDSANGGEDTFHLVYGRPVAKAFVRALLPAPYPLVQGMTLAVEVGGVRYEHSFAASDFTNISNASAYEVVASINKNSAIGFNARTWGGGKYVVIFARQESNEDLTVIEPEGLNAATALSLPTGRADTLRLYLNDRLLFKDGKPATIMTQAQTRWTGLHDGETIVVDVDGTGLRTYTIADADFVAANTGYATVNEANSLEAWAAVLNAKLPGVTATVNGAALELTSNLGASARASLRIGQASSLVLKGVFDSTALEATGRADDYTLDRNLGLIHLTVPLAAGDRLTAGTPFTRAYLESGIIQTTTLADTANLWFAIDGRATRLATGLDATHTLRLTSTTAPGASRRLTASLTNTAAPAYPFLYIQVGDWMVATSDSLFSVPLALQTKGAYRVSAVDPAGQWVEIDAASNYAAVDSLNAGTAYRYLSFYRCASVPQRVQVSAGTYTTYDLVDILNGVLTGAVASVYETTRVRVTTNTYGDEGDVALLAQDDSATALMFTPDVSLNDLPHFAAVESGNSETGTPVVFDSAVVQAVTNDTTFSYDLTGLLASVPSGAIPAIHWMRPWSTLSDRYGQNNGRTDQATTLDLLAPNLVLRSVFQRPVNSDVGGDRFLVTNGFHLGPESTLSLVVDRDSLGQGYDINMFRRLVPDSTQVFGSAMRFFDADLLDGAGLPTPLIQAFGPSFDFSDFVLYSHPRGATHSDAPTKAVMWRAREFWNTALGTLRYALPTLPGQRVASTWTEPDFSVNIVLPSGARKVLPALTAQEKVRVVSTAGNSTVLFGFTGLTLTRAGGVVTCTPTLPAGVTSHGFQVGQAPFLSLTDATFTGGFKTITGVTDTTFTYTEAGADGTQAYAAGTISWTASTLDLTSVLVAGDIASFQNIGSIGTTRVASRISAVHPLYLVTAGGLAASTGVMANFQDVGSADTIQFYPLDQNIAGTGSAPITATWLVNEVAGLPTCPVSGTLIGDGSGVIDFSEANGYCSMSWGILHIASGVSDGSNYTLTMKYPVSGVSLDWANEEFRLVPTTTKNLVDFLSTPAVTGISLSGASVNAVDGARRLQLASGTLGSGSAIQVTGGSANSARFLIQGSAAEIALPTGNLARVTVKKSVDLSAMSSGMYVSIDGLQSLPKPMGWTSLILGIQSNKVSTLNAPPAPAWQFSDGLSAPVFDYDTYIERHGRFTAISDLGATDLSAVAAGDFLTVPPSEGRWSSPLSASGGVAGATFVKMANGHILVCGGGDTIAVREFDPAAGTWTDRANMPGGLSNAKGCLMNDGRVLVCGGTNGGVAVAAGYVYDPTGDSWSTHNMNQTRKGHTLLVFSDGDVWAMCGTSSAGTVLNSFEVLDPATLTWTPMVNNTGTARTGACALRFGGDQAILFGGYNQDGVKLSAVDAMTNYVTRVWAARGNLTSARGSCTAVALPNSKVVVFGGGTGPCDLYDLGNFTSAATGSMQWDRLAPASAVLPDGRVLALGGSIAGGVCRGVEVYNPSAASWSWVAALPMDVTQQQESSLASGGLLTVVGRDGATFVAWTLDIAGAGPQAGNVGTWRVVANNGKTLWVENAASVEERAQVAHLLLRKYGSVMPGDSFQVGTQALGIANQGTFRVNSIDLNDQNSFVVTGMTNVGSTDLAGDTSLVQVLPANPTRVILATKAIIPNAANPDLVDFILAPGKSSWTTDDLCLDRISESGGCVLSALDKLEFPTVIRMGSDAYRYNTGLIGQANRVLYGDESDYQAYPGYVGAGQVVNMSASLVRRIKVSVAVRVRAGKNPKVAIQNAIAKVINGAGPNPIPFSDIIKAVRAVDGVISVVILSPTYDAQHDTIPVQPYETPKVLDIVSDIQVSIIGQ